MKFPALMIHKEFIIGGIRDECALSYASELKMKTRKPTDFQFIDSSGHVFEVEGWRFIALKKVKFSDFLKLTVRELGSPIFNRFSKEPSIWVDYTLSKPSKISLGEAQQIVFDRVCELHPRSKKGGDARQGVKEYLFSASSFEEMINKISVYP